MNPSIRFSNSQQFAFHQSLKQRIQDYFDRNHKATDGGPLMVWKALFWLLLYLGPLVALMVFPMHWTVAALLYFWLGIALAGIGMGVMHDACHNSFSSKAWVNRLFASSIYIIGGNKFSWKMQHNVLHHTYTNIHGADEDITGMALLRFDSHKPLKKVHRYQHWYAPLLYSLMTLSFYFKDINHSLLWTSGKGLKFRLVQMTKLISGKLIYFGILLVLPLLVSPLPWWMVLLGFLLVNLVAGFIMAMVFQLAHIVEGTDQPLPDELGKMEHSWAVHQLQTTANFSPGNLLLTWYVGGLNYQIEHHLFPNISHIHYPAISRIVRSTAEEFGHRYQTFASMTQALGAHFGALRALGAGA